VIRHEENNIAMNEATKGFRAMLRKTFGWIPPGEFHGDITVKFKKGIPIDYRVSPVIKHDELVK